MIHGKSYTKEERVKAEEARSASIESAKPTEIKGQVFLVLNDRQTIRLSLVEVRLMKPDSVEEIFTNDRANARARLSILRSNSFEVSNDIDKLNLAVKLKVQGDAQERDLIANYNERIQLHTDTLRDPQFSDSFKQEARESLNSIRAEIANNAEEERRRLAVYAEVLKRLEKKETELIGISNEMESLEAPETYLSRFASNVISRTTTDVDGRFSVPLPAGDNFILAASVSRSVGDREEKFGWLVPISHSRDKEIVLSNNNLFEPPE